MKDKGIIVISTIALIAIVVGAAAAGAGISYLLFGGKNTTVSATDINAYVTNRVVTPYAQSFNLADTMIHNFAADTTYGDYAYARLGAVYVQKYIDKNISDATALALSDSTLLHLEIDMLNMALGTLNNQFGSNITEFVNNDGVFTKKNITLKLHLDASTLSSGQTTDIDLKRNTVYIQTAWDMPDEGYIYCEDAKIDAECDIVLRSIGGEYKGTYKDGQLPNGLYKFTTTAQRVHGTGFVILNSTADLANYTYTWKIVSSSGSVSYEDMYAFPLPNSQGISLQAVYESNGTVIATKNIHTYGLADLKVYGLHTISYYGSYGAKLRYMLLRDMGYTNPDEIPRDLILPYPDSVIFNTKYFESLSLEELYMLYKQYIKAIWDAMHKYNIDEVVSDPNATVDGNNITIGDIRGKVILCDIYINGALTYVDAYVLIGTWTQKLHLEVGQITSFNTTIPVFIIAANLTNSGTSLLSAPVLNPDDYDVIYTYIELQSGDKVYVKGIWINGEETDSVDIEPRRTDDFDEGEGQGSGGIPWFDIETTNLLPIIAGAFGVILILFGIFRKNTAAVIVGLIIIATIIAWHYWNSRSVFPGWCIWIA